MDFSEKEAMPWAIPEQTGAKPNFYDFPCMMPEFPFPSMPEMPPFFFMPETDFSMLSLKREEDADLPFPLYFFPPEASCMQAETKVVEETTAPQNSVKPPEPIRPRAPYPHAKKVGTITVEERRLKIERYLEKRSRRNYGKKVSYACRKRVADTRIRVKGRFVAKKIAEALKGMENEKNNVAVHLLK